MANYTSQYTGQQIDERLGKAGTAVQPEDLTKTAIGLSNVDDTSDADKPVSTATLQALDGKADKTAMIRLNPSRVTADFAVPSGYNAASVGPITVSEGVTVSIQDNAVWSVH